MTLKPVLDWLWSRLVGVTGQPRTFDPNVLSDPVAVRTEWTPARRGGTSFRTHRAIVRSADRIELRATPAAVASFLIIPLTGLAVFLYGLLSPVSELASIERMAFLTGGPVLIVGGVLLMWHRTAPIVLDQTKGAFWTGREPPPSTLRSAAQGAGGDLRAIHAIQIVSELCRKDVDDPSHLSYELNLVFTDGARLTLIDHGHLEGVRRDARILSSFLSVPLWDSTVTDGPQI